MSTYRVEHVTRYRYADDVSASYGRAHLLPRSTPGQSIVGGTVAVEPAPQEQRDHIDFFGNVSTYYAVRTPHRELRVAAHSEVTVDRGPASSERLDATRWEAARDVDVDARAFVLASPGVELTDPLRAYAAESFTPGRGLGSAVAELVARIHTDFEYRSGATTVTTTLTEVMQARHGVCQDFAHLAVGCLRSVGLPARYVSGYLETDPPAGQPKLQGADASHAWAAVLAPGVGWVDVDPTNDQFVDDRYVTVGWGRDYSDVPPLKGVILTNAKRSTMQVSVDVTRIG